MFSLRSLSILLAFSWRFLLAPILLLAVCILILVSEGSAGVFAGPISQTTKPYNVHESGGSVYTPQHHSGRLRVTPWPFKLRGSYGV